PVFESSRALWEHAHCSASLKERERDGEGILQGHMHACAHSNTLTHTHQTCRHCHSCQLLIERSGSIKEERWKRLTLRKCRKRQTFRLPEDHLKPEVQLLHLGSPAARHIQRCRFLEDRNGALKLELAALKQLKQQLRSLFILSLLPQPAAWLWGFQCAFLHEELGSIESEVSERRKRCQQLEREVKNKTLACKTLRTELQDALLERSRLKRELLSHILKTAEHEKHMQEAADRRQQLEAEHEQALAFLNSRQQEINLLQKVQTEAEKEREEVVHLLEVKVHDLEQKCQAQSEQCTILSKELEKYHLGSDAEETFNADSRETKCNIYNSLQHQADTSK
ncbi:hypothetical protein DNTS_028898, partial [Danionella cerebrum]